jgi:FixJ family two-component response regulator
MMSERPGNAQATVYVVDDDPDVGKTIALAAEPAGLQVIALASAEAFLAAYDGRRPGCIVLDVMLPGMTGVAALRRFAQDGIRLPVIMLSGYGDIPTAVACMRLGALDFVEKPFKLPALFDSIRSAIAQDSERIEPDRAADLANRRLANLSSRERQVLQLVIEGKSSKGIGQLLGISDKTVDVHRSNMMRKAGTRSVAELVKLAVISQRRS